MTSVARLRLAQTASPGAEGRATTPSGTLAYTIAGSGEPLLLIHGLGSTRHTWRQLIDSLATTHRVIAPDLPGHGDSDAPAGDYSLGAHATALRDLLIVLGHPAATIAGHSLGGGVALQFAYQFPERTRRLLLLSSGGLGGEVNPMLRAATLPGAQAFVAAVARIPLPLTLRALPALALIPGLLARQDSRSVANDLRRLAAARHRRAFIRTARAVLDWRGQSVSATRQFSLLAHLPVFVAWGSRDRIIPPDHQRALLRQLPDAQFLEVKGAGHYPHETAANELLPAIHHFLETTAPFRFTERQWRALIDVGAVEA